MAQNGNLTCQRVLREAATLLGVTLGNLANVLNPEVVVLGGAFGRADALDFTLDSCREAIGRSGLQAVAEGVRVPPAQQPATADKKLLRVEASTLQHSAAHGALILSLQGTEV
jgi:predicted NBD/HSP70 family sugar kinase